MPFVLILAGVAIAAMLYQSIKDGEGEQGSYMRKLHPLDRIIITSGFGNRPHPLDGTRIRFHSGLDLAASIGEPVYAVARGQVIASYLSEGKESDPAKEY